MVNVTTEDRVRHLERRTTLLSIVALSGVALAIAGWMSGVSKVVKANELQIVSSKGVKLATIGPSPRGGGGEIILFDAKGTPQGSWFAQAPSFSMLKVGGLSSKDASALILAAGFGGAILQVRGSGRSPAKVFAGADKVPDLLLYDSSGKVVFVARPEKQK